MMGGGRALNPAHLPRQPTQTTVRTPVLRVGETEEMLNPTRLIEICRHKLSWPRQHGCFRRLANTSIPNVFFLAF